MPVVFYAHRQSQPLHRTMKTARQSECGHWQFAMITPAVYGFLAVAMALVLGCQKAPAPPAAGAAPPANTGTVTIEIEGSPGKSMEVEGVAQGTTLETVMQSLDQIPVTITGSGTTAFVDAIGDKATSGSEGWTFKVDGEFANAGIGSTVLSPPTTVTWSYRDGLEEE